MLSPLPPLPPPPPLFAADVEDGRDDDCEEDDGRRDGSVDCAVEALGETSSVEEDELKGDISAANEVLEDVTGEVSDVGDTVDEEEVEGTALDAL